jgi:hypothetical protein
MAVSVNGCLSSHLALTKYTQIHRIKVTLEIKITIDSNALTYLLQSMEPEYDPVNDLARTERIAMIRTFMYFSRSYYILPEVGKEYQRIKGQSWRKSHENLVGSLLHEVDWSMDENELTRKRDYFLSRHSKAADCRVLAEAELANMDVLLSNDKKFIERLSDLTAVNLTTPSSFWHLLGLSPGSDPLIIPNFTNPLYFKGWWRI